MRPAIILTVLVLLTAATAHGDSYFTDLDLTGLRVTRADPQQGKARISSPNAVMATIRPGDTIGRNEAEVIKIGERFITVKTRKGKTRLPVITVSPQNIGGVSGVAIH